MKRFFATSAALGNVLLFATYYSVTKGALARIDSVMLAFFQIVILAPIAFGLLITQRHRLTRNVWIHGSLLGGCLGFLLISFAVALRYTSATESAFFPCLNGIFAALFTGLILRQPVARGVWVTALIACIGMVLMIGAPVARSHWRGDCAALLGAFASIAYLFLVNRFAVRSRDGATVERGVYTSWSRLPIFAVQLTTMIILATIVSLLFGDWSAVRPHFPSDGWVIAFIGLTIIIEVWDSPFIVQHVSPTTVSYIYILQPVIGGLIAHFSLGEMFSARVYEGQALIIAAVILQTSLSLAPSRRRPREKSTNMRLVERTVPPPFSLRVHLQRRLASLCTAAIVLAMVAFAAWWPVIR